MLCFSVVFMLLTIIHTKCSVTYGLEVKEESCGEL